MSSILVRTSQRQVDLALVMLRIAIGVVFAAHGAQKVFVFTFAGVGAAFGQMGIPLPGITGPMVAMLELIGGTALALGLLTRPAAALLAANMLGALFLVHLPAGFFLPNGIEFVLALFAGAAAVAVAGPGRYSIDQLVAGRTTKVEEHVLRPAARRAA
jgi:putative oxidoreductase